MENATKALLIAASVLIVIVLIALGVKLLGSTEETAESAKIVGNSIGEQTQDLSSSIVIDLTDVSSMTDLEFSIFIYNNFFYENVGEINGKKVLKMCELIRKKYGNLRDNIGGQSSARAHITSSGSFQYTYENIEKTITEELGENKKYKVNCTNVSYKPTTSAGLPIKVTPIE